VCVCVCVCVYIYIYIYIYIYSGCLFVDLGIIMQSTCAMLASVVCPDVQYFSTLSHKRNDLKKLNMKCVLIFSTTHVRNMSHSKKN